MSLISEINQAKPPSMTEQQQQRDDSACAVDLSASALPESEPNAEVFTTTITPSEPESGFAGFGFSVANALPVLVVLVLLAPSELVKLWHGTLLS